MILSLVAPALAGALNGLIVAFIIKWAGKRAKLPMWPVVTGLLLGLAVGLRHFL